MKQCRLRKGNCYHVAWLPARYAVKGKYVKLLRKAGWSDGWKVIAVGTFLETVETPHGYLSGGVFHHG